MFPLGHLASNSVMHTQVESVGCGSHGWEQDLGPSRPSQWSGVEGTFFTLWWWLLAARTVTLYHKVCGFLFSIKSNKLDYLYHPSNSCPPSLSTWGWAHGMEGYSALLSFSCPLYPPRLP